MKTNIETRFVSVNGTGARTEAPKTLRELGLDGGLAADFELVLQLMGAVEGDRVVGFTFTTPDGQRHPLRIACSEPQANVARAA